MTEYELKCDVKAIKKELMKQLDEKRYEHTIGVADTAACLAMRYGIDMQKAYVAGLLHDCAKNFDSKKRNRLCEKYKIELTEYELKNPALIHAKLGAKVAAEKYGIDDSEILNAIRFHTTGKKEMTVLEKIIYAADFIEPNRKMLAVLPEIRNIIFKDLDEAVYLILNGTVAHLEGKELCIDPASLEAFQYYKQIHLHKDNSK